MSKLKSIFIQKRKDTSDLETTSKYENRFARKKLQLLFILCLLLSTAFSYILSTQPTTLIRSDHFSRWYATNKLIYEGRSLYDPQNGKEIVALNSIPFDPIEGSFFYPAYLMVFILPIVWLPYPLAHFIWLILIQMFLVVGIWMIYKEVNWPGSVNIFTVFLFLSILCIPNIQNTIWGQFNTIAVISLAMVFICLRRKQYLLAGFLATGMTFKPQQILLTLLFFLIWSLFRRERWGFFIGFSLGMAILWFVANLFEPNWVGSFLQGLKNYQALLHPDPALKPGGIPEWVIFLLLGLLSVWLLGKNLISQENSTAFAGSIILSMGIWWLAVPVLGMIHLVALPISLILLFAGLKIKGTKLYSYGMIIFGTIYLLGLAGFLYGLLSPGLYGLHIKLAELAYKQIAPILLILFALPLCISSKNEMLPQNEQLQPR